MTVDEDLKKRAREFLTEVYRDEREDHIVEDLNPSKIEKLLDALDEVNKADAKPIRPNTLDKYFVLGARQGAREDARKAAIDACFALLYRWAGSSNE